MITKPAFEKIKRNHGRYASWAVWGPIGATPASGMDDLRVFETDAVLSILRPDVVMLGLNVSKSITLLPPLSNFHRARNAHDYKTRYAFKDTEYYGAYMTDFIKNLPEVGSGEAANQLTPQLLKTSMDIFRQEMKDLGNSRPPVILAFGDRAYDLACKHFQSKEEYYSLLVPLRHYSDYRLNKEAYKELVFNQIAAHKEKEQYPAKENVK